MLCRVFNPFVSNQRQVIFAVPFIRGFTSRREEALNKVKKEIEESKKNLQWRKPNESNQWRSKLKAFSDDEQNSDFIQLMQQFDLSPKGVKNWWKNRKEYIDHQMQRYVPERHEILGSDLAAAHFVVYRGGAVKFIHKSEWIRADENDEYDLPAKYNPLWKLEAIRCDNMTLYYEGLENIRSLQNLKFWSLINVKTIDDWCLDRISSAQNPILEVLDLTGTNITYRGLSALYRIDSLKVLVVDDPKVSKEFELACALLEEAIPRLQVRAAKDIH